MHEFVNLLRNINNPTVLSRESLLGKGREGYEHLTINELEAVKIKRIVEVLGQARLKSLVNEGKVTLALIKPRTSENRLGLGELDAFYRILSEVKSPLEPVFQISVLFSESDVEEFYKGGPKKSQLASASIRKHHKNRWEEFKEYMTSGPTTFILLYSAVGNASTEWRKQIGHWDVQDRPRDPATIRGKFALDNYTSLVHGSDNPKAILREIEFLRLRLSKFI